MTITGTEAAPAGNGTPSPSFRSNVARDRVHRWALGEVFVTDAVNTGENRFTCAAQLPRWHAYFGDNGLPGLRHFDPLLLVEAARQAALLVAHDFYDVPADHKFVLTGAAVDVPDVAALRVGDTPGELVADVLITDVTTRRGRVTGLRYTGTGTLNGRPIGTSEIGLVFNPPDNYRLLRDRDRAGAGLPALADSGDHAPQYPFVPPLSPERVGRARPENVVLGPLRATEAGPAAQLVVDPGHPSLFDHPQDHLPGMVMGEAFRQLAIAAGAELHALDPARAVLRRCAMTYQRFGELELPSTGVVTGWQPPRRDADAVVAGFSLRLEQRDSPLATAEVELAYPLGREG